MPYIAYDEINMKSGTLAIIQKANEIATEYHDKGYEMTLRQLYYQFVARDLIPNTERSYKNLGSAVNKGRMCGMIDWGHITDRTRSLEGNPNWENPGEIIEASARAYNLDKWADQDKRVEVWIEKDALIGVIEGVCSRMDVDYFSCRGYTSQSEMWRAACRMMIRQKRQGQTTVILHLGDHDPSGIDMSNDIQKRLRIFGAQIEFHRIALNMDQIEEFNPPPNPTKLTDSRANSYVDEFGLECWELDALPPDDMEKLVEREIKRYCDIDAWDEIKERQEEEREILDKAADNWDDVTEYVDEL